MADKKISELSAAGALSGVELVEVVKGGINVQTNTQAIADLAGSGITREFNRTFSETLVFDKNEIYYAVHEMVDDINFVIGSGLVDSTSAIRARIHADGVHSISFGDDFDFIYGITNGQILEEGLYEVYFLYVNGSVSVNVPGVSSESSTITQLLAPADFAAVADGENEIDLSWTDVANETNYRIEKSADGVSGWALLTEPAAGATSANETGLSAGQTVFYRIKAVGDGVNFSDSPWSTASATTESAGDVTAPTFTFSPEDTDTDVPVNQPIVITASEPLRDDDGVTEITNANVDDYITLKETNSGGADIPFTATIDATKTIITINPNPSYGNNQLVYVAIDGVEDVNGNESVLTSITFTSSDYTSFFDGQSNMLLFGNAFNNIFTVANGKFKIKITVKSPAITGNHMLCAVYSKDDNQRCFYWSINDQDIECMYFPFVGDNTRFRRIRAVGVVSDDDTDQVFELHYDGSLDTNNGLDRVEFWKNGINLANSLWGTQSGALHDNLATSTAQFTVGQSTNVDGTPTTTSWFLGLAKDLIILSGAGDVEELNVPELRTGIDVSGNNRHGTWV